jgi:lysophospholipase L1-like esterase
MLLAFSTANAFAQHSKSKETIDWSHTWIIKTADTSRIPGVLVIGDSHVERYQPEVANKLKGKAIVNKITTSKSMGDPAFVKQLEVLLEHYEFDYIFFNNGLHGVNYTPGEYAADLPKVLNILKRHLKTGKIFWINTTARRVNEHLEQFDPYQQDVVERNRLVQDFCQKNNIRVLDFFSLSKNNISYYSNDGIHFNETGVDAQATLIAEIITAIINKMFQRGLIKLRSLSAIRLKKVD